MLDGDISWTVPAGKTEYIVLSRFPQGSATPMVLAQYAEDDTVIGENPVNTAYFKIRLSPDASTLKLSGKAEIVEIVGR